MKLWRYLIGFVLISAFALVQANTLKDINGEYINLDQYKGKWIFINYWASWCQPCVEEIGELNKFYRHNQDKVALFAVNYEGISLAKQRKVIKKLGLLYPSLGEDPAFLFHLKQPRGVPATFIFNPKGELYKTLYGSQTLSSLNQVLKS